MRHVFIFEKETAQLAPHFLAYINHRSRDGEPELIGCRGTQIESYSGGSVGIVTEINGSVQRAYLQGIQRGMVFTWQQWELYPKKYTAGARVVLSRPEIHKDDKNKTGVIKSVDAALVVVKMDQGGYELHVQRAELDVLP